MNDAHKALLRALADHNLNVSEVSRHNYVHRNTVLYHIAKIQKETGLDPKTFWGLKKLLEEYASEGDLQ